MTLEIVRMPMFALILVSLFPLGQATTQPAGATDALAAPYTDATFGYSISAPTGWQLITQRELVNNNLILLRMVQAAGPMETHTISLQQATTAKPVVIGDELKLVGRLLDIGNKNVQIEAQQEQQIAGRNGGFFSATYTQPGDRVEKPSGEIVYLGKDRKMLRLQALIPSASKEYYTIVYDGPVAARDKAEPLFQQVLASFHFLPNRLDSDEMKKVLAKGSEWLANLSPTDITRAVVDSEAFIFQLEGKDVGFVEIVTSREEWQKHAGIQIYERSWLFEQEGNVRRTQNAMFLSDDMNYERWLSSFTTWGPSKGGQPERFDNSTQKGLRDHNVLLSSQATSLGEPEFENPPAKLPKTYISRALVRLFPRMVGELDKPRTYAFVTYDHHVAGLIAKVLELKGATTLPNNDGVKAYRIDEREGMAATPNELYVDAKGKILFVRTGKLTMRPTDVKELERLFGDRMEQAGKAMDSMEVQYQQSGTRFGSKSKAPTAKPPVKPAPKPGDRTP